MNIDYKALKSDERAIFELRSLYRKYGYSQYKMSKFEEYDLYVRNKSFLVSDNIITFTDTNGKLMALKPDVTLSIIKNSRDDKNSLRKVYYNENVYRVSGSTHYYKEIMQVGLECIGAVDTYSIYEVIMLAAESLGCISEDFVLDVSHLGIVSSVIDAIGPSDEARAALLSCIADKNSYGICEICEREGLDSKALTTLVSAYGSIDKVLGEIKDIACCEKAAKELESVMSLIKNSGFADRINIDFSVINDMNYYNGFVFKGFINGIESGILSGGQYDKLMSKMGKKSSAIGFAVYTDMLERLGDNERGYDVDTVILYDEKASADSIASAVKMLTANGKSVMAQRRVPEKLKYKQLVRLNEKGLEIIENNA